MATSFKTVLNNVSTTLAAVRSSGGTSITVATGTGTRFGSTFPLRVTLAQASTPSNLTIFLVTARTGDVLTIGAAQEGTTDRDYAIGDTVEMRATAQTFGDIHTAINTAETTLDGIASTYSPLAGSSSITTVGTITAGSWSGTAIATSKGGTGLTSIGTAFQLVGVNSGASGLQYTSLAAGTGVSISSATNTITISAPSVLSIGSAVGSSTAGSILFVDGSNNLAQSTNLTINTSTFRVGIGSVSSPGAMLHAQSLTTTTPGIISQAIASQTAGTYLFQGLASDGTTSRFSVDPSGNTLIAGTLGVTGAISAGTSGMTTGNIVINQFGLKLGFNGQISSAAGSTIINNAAGPLITQNDLWQQTASQTVPVYVVWNHSTTVRESTAITFSSAAQWIGTRFNYSFGNGAITYNTANPITAVQISPTFNLATASTGNVAALLINPTYTSIGTGTIPDTIRIQDGGTDRFKVDRYGRMISATAAPTIAGNAGAGTTPTVSISGTDQAGVISVTTGTTPSASADVATITFSQAFATAPKAVLITPANATTAALSGNALVFVDPSNTSTTVFKLTVGSTNLTGATAYKWSYHVL